MNDLDEKMVDLENMAITFLLAGKLLVSQSRKKELMIPSRIFESLSQERKASIFRKIGELGTEFLTIFGSNFDVGFLDDDIHFGKDGQKDGQNE